MRLISTKIFVEMIFILLVAFVVLQFAQPKNFSDRVSIELELQTSNYCVQSTDCAFVNTKCPFPCNAAVNREKLNEVNALVDSFESGCAYRCVAPSALVCEAGRCTAKP